MRPSGGRPNAGQGGSAIGAAAESLTKLIEHLPSNAVADAVATGRSAMVDRSVHWDPHLGEMKIR